MKMAIFWVVAPCSLAEVYKHFMSLIALMMEAARTSETLVNFYQTTWGYNPEDSHLRYFFYSWCVAIQAISHMVVWTEHQ
jgi:uncharacterized protein YecA (UPF0149 family)